MNFLRRLFAPKRPKIEFNKSTVRFMKRWKRKLEFRIRTRERFAIGGSPADRLLMRNARKRERQAGTADGEVFATLIAVGLAMIVGAIVCYSFWRVIK